MGRYDETIRRKCYEYEKKKLESLGRNSILLKIAKKEKI